MKLWIDDVQPAPEGYKWCKSVHDAIKFIEANEAFVNRCVERSNRAFLERDYIGNANCCYAANYMTIELIDIDHDAGDYAYDGAQSYGRVEPRNIVDGQRRLPLPLVEDYAYFVGCLPRYDNHKYHCIEDCGHGVVRCRQPRHEYHCHGWFQYQECKYRCLR